ncbi:MAG: pyruvate kinase [Actinobacteria bacterium]|nr:pyruvate kinase [Actinomycetota bacterium]
MMRRTKIIATVGPACSTSEQITALANAGADVLRINCSHQSTQQISELIDRIRSVAPSVAILVDIQGPKHRYIGSEQMLHSGALITFALSDIGLSTTTDAREQGIEVGHRVLLNDGRLEVVIEKVGRDSIEVRVVQGGALKPGKGVNMPDTEVTDDLLTAKDRSDIAVARAKAVEVVALSFVQKPQDIEQVRELVGSNVMVVAKIERPQALERISEICAVSDGVMAARGDLGVELPFEVVPAAQHKIARTALTQGVISICATEMLESMTTSTRPTRAEVADVTGAVRDGFDAVMLSGETAVGIDPPHAVEVMARICEAAEKEVVLPNLFADTNPMRAGVTASASALAKRMSADVLLSLTFTGHSALLLAACRPTAPIVAITPSEVVARQMRLVWGLYPVVAERASDLDEAIASALTAARKQQLIGPGNTVVICASRSNPRSNADTIWLHTER